MTTNQSSKYDIYYNGIYKGTINPQLVRSKGITDEQLRQIKDLYVEKIDIETLMAGTKREHTAILKSFFEDWTKVQMKIQKAWGSQPDPTLHPFWQVPHCECPHAGTQFQSEPIVHYNPKCPVHG